MTMVSWLWAMAVSGVEGGFVVVEDSEAVTGPARGSRRAG